MGTNEFAPNASLTLTANTKYWIVAEGGIGQWEYFTDKGESTTSPVDGTPRRGLERVKHSHEPILQQYRCLQST